MAINPFKRRLTAADIPGYTGGTLEDELLRQQDQRQSAPGRMSGVPSSQVAPTMADQYMAQAQPVDASVSPFKQRLMQTPAQPEAFGSSGEPFMAGRERRTQPRDFAADDSQYLRDVQSKPLSLRDKAGLVAQSIATNLGGKPLATRRQRDEARAEGQLGQDIAIQKAQTAQDLSRMVPVTLPDGTTTYTPARTAATLLSRNQEQGLNRAQREAAAKAHKDRWAQMGQHERVQDALRVYNSGGANDPETLAAISDTLQLPKDLQPKFVSGEVALQTDDKGQVQAYNKRTGVKADTGITSWNVTAESGRNTRRDKNAADAMERTRIIAASGAAKMGDVPELEKTRGMLETYADEKEQEAQELAGSNMKSDKEKASKLQAEATQYRLHAAALAESAAKAKGAQAASAPRQGTNATAPLGFVDAFKKKNGRAPTQAEINAYAAAASRQ